MTSENFSGDDELNQQDIVAFKEDSMFTMLRKFAGRIPFAEDAVAGYYAMLDSDVPISKRTALLSALIYVVSPIDAVPDVIPGVGLLDDAGVLAAAIAFVGTAITIRHRRQAKKALLREDIIEG